MKTTIFTTDIVLWKLDGETVRLARPSWDCGWYWGFGYIQNRNLHTHFDSFDRENNRNLHDSIKQRFTGWGLTDADTWTFCELIKTFYALKETAEVLGRGGSHYTKNPLAELIKNPAEVERINGEIMPALFDAIYTLFREGTERKKEEERQKIEKEKERAREQIEKAKKEIENANKTLASLSAK